MNNLGKIGLGVLVSVLAACNTGTPTLPSGNNTGNTGNTNTNGTAGPAVRTYLQSLPEWASFSPQKDDAEVPTPAGQRKETTPDGVKMVCTTTHYDLTRSPNKIAMYEPDKNVMFAGNVLQGKGYLKGLGSLVTLQAPRAPLTLFVDLLGPNVTREVNSPNAATIQQAIGEIVSSAKGKVSPQLETSFNSVTHTSNQQTTLKLGLSAKFLKAFVDSKFTHTTTKDENSVVAYLVQSAYTAAVVPPTTPEGFFSNGLTEAELKDLNARGHLGVNNLPVYISSVTYGKILMFRLTSKTSKQDILASIQAGFGKTEQKDGQTVVAGDKGFVVSSSLSRIASSTDTTLEVAAIGGTEEQARNAIKSGNLGAYFETDTPLDAYKPISFEIRNLSDGTIAKVVETSEYNITQCEPESFDRYKITLMELRNIQGFNSFASLNGTLTVADENLWSATQQATINKNDGTSLQLNPGSVSEGVKDGGAVLVTTLEQPVSLVGRVYDWSGSVGKNFRVWENTIAISKDTPLNQVFEVPMYGECKGNGIFPRRDTCGGTLVYKVEKLQ